MAPHPQRKEIKAAMIPTTTPINRYVRVTNNELYNAVLQSAQNGTLGIETVTDDKKLLTCFITDIETGETHDFFIPKPYGNNTKGAAIEKVTDAIANPMLYNISDKDAKLYTKIVTQNALLNSDKDSKNALFRYDCVIDNGEMRTYAIRYKTYADYLSRENGERTAVTVRTNSNELIIVTCNSNAGDYADDIDYLTICMQSQLNENTSNQYSAVFTQLDYEQTQTIQRLI